MDGSFSTVLSCLRICGGRLFNLSTSIFGEVCLCFSSSGCCCPAVGGKEGSLRGFFPSLSLEEDDIASSWPAAFSLCEDQQLISVFTSLFTTIITLPVLHCGYKPTFRLLCCGTSPTPTSRVAFPFCFGNGYKITSTKNARA